MNKSLPLMVIALLFLSGYSVKGGQEGAFSLSRGGDTPDVSSMRLVDGKFGKALDLSTGGRYVAVHLEHAAGTQSLALECWVRLDSVANYNIIFASAPKKLPSPKNPHWELYTKPGSGALEVYIPQIGKISTNCRLTVGQWHFLAFRIGEKSIELCADGRRVLRREFDRQLTLDDSPLLIGKIEGGSLPFDGAVDELHIRCTEDSLEEDLPIGPPMATPTSLAIYHFDQVDPDTGSLTNAVSSVSPIQAFAHDDLLLPIGNRFLDEVQDELYAKSVLHGSRSIEEESKLPIYLVEIEPIGEDATETNRKPLKISLDGSWRMKGSAHRVETDLKVHRTTAIESQGTREGWFKSGYDRSDWFEIQVPTSVQSALLKLGEIKDPFWDSNTYDELVACGEPKEEKRWHYRQTPVERQDWWFARTFTLPPEWKGQDVRLYFDGIDVAGSFYLNGHSLGYHTGMFGGPEYDITELLHYDRMNELVVRVDAVPELWSGVLKGSPGWGWHYGHLISLGIWRSVELQAVPEIEISSLFIQTESIDKDQAELVIEYTITSKRPKPTQVEVVGNIAGSTFESQPVSFRGRTTVHYGKSRYRMKLKVETPRLWWPLNYGAQDMYRLSLSVSQNGAMGDIRETSFGIRTVKMLPLRGTLFEKDYRWQFVINGVPMFIKGANWCWTDPMLEVDPAKYEHFTELARRAGIQMFRSWGGGIIEADEFYRLCDEKGVMVYQEFPYCWGPPDFPLTDPHMLDDQVTRVVKRLRNHPSLVMWGGGNENRTPAGNDEGLLLVGRRCRQYDPSRPFHRTSPWGGSLHNWDVFHNGQPIDSGFTSLSTPWFSEFGIPSMTSWDESLNYLPLEKLQSWPPAQQDGGIISHMNQFSYGDIVKVMRYADYGPINSWQQYIEYSQMAQGDEIRFVANLQRAGSYLNKGGLWFYKMSELFPGQSWGITGYYGHPKLSYYRTKQVYQPQAAFAHSEKFNWVAGEFFVASLHVNNDSSKPLENATATAVIYGSNLAPVWTKEYSVDSVGTSQRIALGKIEVQVPESVSKPFLLAVALRDAEGRLLSDQWTWYNYQAKTPAVKKLEEIPAWGWPHARAPEAFKAYGSLPEARLLTLPQVKLSAELTCHGRVGAITIQNLSNLPAFNVIIDHFPHAYGAYLDDNSFSLYPHEKRIIRFELASEEAKTDTITVRAWNAPEVKPR